MIKRALLKTFGKFRDASFDFSPMTLFVGSNESGKTTIFDALFNAICKPRGSTVHGKRLSLRYGEDRDSSLDFEGDDIVMDPEEFLNLNAIGAGNTHLDFSSGKSWIERVKASIFTGGVDPKRLAAGFDSLSKDRGNLTHVKDMKDRENARSEIRKELESLEKKKTAILEGEKSIRRRRGDLDSLSVEIRETAASVKDCEHRLEQQEKIRERESVMKALELIAGTSSMRADLERFGAVKVDATAKLKGMEAAVNDLKMKKSSHAREADSAAARLETAERKLEERVGAIEALRAMALAAAQILSRIEIEAPRPVVRLVTSWKMSLLLLSLLPLGGGAVLMFFMTTVVLKASVLIGGVVIALVIAFLARKTAERRVDPDVSGFLARMKDDWRIRSGGGELKSESVEGLQTELHALRGKCDAAEQELVRLREERDALREESARLSKLIAQLDAEFSSERSLLEESLRTCGAGSVEEYIHRRSEYEHLLKAFESQQAALEVEMKKYAVNSVEKLKAECEARAARLKEEITAESLNEAGINRLRNELAALRQELKTASAREAELRSTVDKGEGEVKGSLGDLPGQIYEKKQALFRIDGELRAMEIARKAASMARDIFNDMSRDSDVIFDALGADIARYFGGFLPETRRIAMSDFASGGITVDDAGGSGRSLENLSTGTRDAFYLAARLALALRCRENGGAGIIVLDEPFHSLDRPRILRTLEVLVKFQGDHGWQIVIFSKEEDLADEMKKLLPGITVHRLAVAKPA